MNVFFTKLGAALNYHSRLLPISERTLLNMGSITRRDISQHYVTIYK